MGFLACLDSTTFFTHYLTNDTIFGKSVLNIKYVF